MQTIAQLCADILCRQLYTESQKRAIFSKL